MYLLLDGRSVGDAYRNGVRLVSEHILDTKALVVLLFFVLAVAPSIIYAALRVRLRRLRRGRADAEHVREQPTRAFR